MAKQKEIRTRWVNTRLSEAEYIEMMTQFTKTSHKDLSEFFRRSITGKPVNLAYRNQSIDDFLADMLALRRELNAIGNNINQAVHRLHSLSEIIDIQHWLLSNEQDKSALFKKMEDIQNRINQLYQLWS